MADFKRLMFARFFFNFAIRMQAVIVGWQMYELTKDPLHLGLIGLAEAIPALSIAIYAGYVVDRSPPLRIYTLVQVGSLISALIVWIAQLVPSLSLPQQVWALYTASFVTGCARGFAQPSMFALVPRLISRAELSKASAWLSSALQTASILGPFIGAMVFGWSGMTAASALPVITLAIGLMALRWIKARPGPPQAQGQKPIRDELLSGAAFVWKHPILLPALSLDMISVLFGGVTALLPIYASDILHVGVKGLGILRAGPAVGSMLMSYLLTRMDIRRQAGPWLLVAVAGFGMSIVVFGFSETFWLSLVALSISGACDSVSVVVRSAAVQLASPDHMRGRISAINSIFIGSSNELGEFESGMAAKFLGTVPAVVLGGAACLLTVTFLGLRSRALRGLDLTKL